jgi:aryl-alcohol dehydrogenase-like predicted oxidoreductase
MAFERRVLGGTNLIVSPVAIGGGYGIGAEALEWGFEHGINTFFWAPWLFTYRSMERCLKRLLPRHREEIVIVTAPYSWLLPGSLERAARSHLRRLGIRHIDLLVLGMVMRESQQRAVAELVRLKEQGLVRAIGFSGHNRSLMRRLAERWPVFDVLMVRYNAAHRGIERDLFDHLDAAIGHGIVAFNALKHGNMLKRPRGWPASRPVPIASQCYRFVLSHPRVHLCLAGPRTLGQVQELVRVMEDGPLPPDELAFLCDFGDARHG